jgi:hypothetical protein
MNNGTYMLQLKTVTNSNKDNICYFKIIIDRDLPRVIIDKPFENDEVNDKIFVRGSADDPNGKVQEVRVSLNRFDKNLGKIPKFIQGIYLWAQAFSGPWVSGGVGLSFFDDVVRVEGIFGWTPTKENVRDMGYDPLNVPQGLLRTSTDPTNTRYEPRFSGYVTGGKLLARVIDIPFEFFFGEDAKNFSISLEIGAGFFWYSGFAAAKNELNNSYYAAKRGPTPLDTTPLVYDTQLDSKLIGAFMYQVDFFKVERFGPFRKFALYFENSFLFVTSDTKTELVPLVGVGLRNAFF